MQAIIFALISYFGWGVGDFFAAISARKLGGYSSVLWSNLIITLGLSAYIPFAINDLQHATPTNIFLTIIGGLCGMIAFVAFNEAVQTDKASLVGTISSCFSAVVVLLSVIFFREKITVIQLAIITTIFIGLILTSLNFQDLRKGRIITRGVVLSLVAMLLWGFFYTFIKIPVKELGLFWPNFAAPALFPLLFLFMKVRKIKINRPTSKTGIPLTFSVITFMIAEFSYTYGINQGLSSIVAPIAGAYPTLFVVLSFLFFREKVSRQQLVGIIITLIGIVVLSVFSV